MGNDLDRWELTGTRSYESAQRLGRCDVMLKPYCVPQRVVAYSLDQPGSQGVCNDVAAEFFQVVFGAEGCVVVSALPYTVLALDGFVDCDGASGFDLLHDAGKGFLLQLDEPMQVIGHHYPG